MTATSGKGSGQLGSSCTGDRGLVRGLTLFPATALNMVDMIGVGPFITLPLMVAAMGGATLPRVGGSYEYLKQMYGRSKAGRWLSFLFVFQLVFSAPVSIATGCIGFANYTSYVFSGLSHVIWRGTLPFYFLGPVRLTLEVSGRTLVAVGTAMLATVLVYRRVASIGRISRWLWIGVVGAIGFVALAALTHFRGEVAFPDGWSQPHAGFFSGLSAALLFALYDYWGYYNICFLVERSRGRIRPYPARSCCPLPRLHHSTY